MRVSKNLNPKFLKVSPFCGWDWERKFSFYCYQQSPIFNTIDESFQLLSRQRYPMKHHRTNRMASWSSSFRRHRVQGPIGGPNQLLGSCANSQMKTWQRTLRIYLFVSCKFTAAVDASNMPLSVTCIAARLLRIGLYECAAASSATGPILCHACN